MITCEGLAMSCVIQKVRFAELMHVFVDFSGSKGALMVASPGMDSNDVPS